MLEPIGNSEGRFLPDSDKNSCYDAVIKGISFNNSVIHAGQDYAVRDIDIDRIVELLSDNRLKKC